MVTSQWHLANNNLLFSPHYRKSIPQNANKEVVAIKLLSPGKGGNGDGEAARCESGISAEWVFLCFLWERRTKSTPEQSQRDRPSHPVYLSYPILKVTQGNLKTLKHKPNPELPGGKKIQTRVTTTAAQDETEKRTVVLLYQKIEGKIGLHLWYCIWPI